MIDTNHIQDGVHFGLDDTLYHAIAALSSTGIKNILISAPDFWYRTPWLNPDYEEEDTDTAAKTAGRAYHARTLEGKPVFEKRYGPTFEAPDDCLRTIEDIELALAALGQSDLKFKRKSQWVEAIRDADPSAPLYDDLKEAHEARHEGKELLSPKLIASIHTAAAMIENHPELSKLFGGGFPEVTIIWTENGVRMKARIDYLKCRAFSDLKTFENYMNKPIDSAIYGAMAKYKYHIQFSLYMRATDRAKSLPVFTHNDAPAPDEQWLQDFRASEPHGCYACFQQKGIAPLARGKKFLRGSVWSCGEATIEQAVNHYRKYTEQFGNLPWVDMSEVTEFEDIMMPAYAVEL